jgi:hypothetical protein
MLVVDSIEGRTGQARVTQVIKSEEILETAQQ